MDKQEYHKLRFRKDFLRYSLLQEDSLTAEAIAKKVFASVQLGSLVEECSRCIGAICDKYLSFDKIVDGDRLLNQLPQELELQIRDSALTEFSQALSGIIPEELVDAVVGGIARSIELQSWDNGVSMMPSAIDHLLKRLNASADAQMRMLEELPAEELMHQKYDAACRNTLVEQLKGNNHDDIIEYRNVLLEYVRAACKNIMRKRIADLYLEIARHPLMSKLQQNILSIVKYAEELYADMPQIEPVSDWDREYDHQVPTEFYRRNAENVSSEKAFHMLLLLFFSRNEDWLLENGMLVDGQLKIYTNEDWEAVVKVMERLESVILS